MPLISIIIPIYNVEKYLETCIDSVLTQTFTDFECILVNDGSPDNSPKICDEYAKKDERIKVIHKENGGLSSARNAGLDVALGEWIGFVDSDDWVDPEMFNVLYQNAIKHDADVSICGVMRVSEGREIIQPMDKRDLNVVLTPKETLLLMFHWKSFMDGYSVNKLFKKRVIKKKNLRFSETVRYMEDVLFCYDVFKNVDKVHYTSQPYYFYRQRKSSITQTMGFTTAAHTAIEVFDKLHKIEQDLEILQKIVLKKQCFITRICIDCVYENKKDEAFKTNVRILKKSFFSGDTLPLRWRCKIFVLIFFPFILSHYNKWGRSSLRFIRHTMWKKVRCK